MIEELAELEEVTADQAILMFKLYEKEDLGSLCHRFALSNDCFFLTMFFHIVTVRAS